jgi:hypothetical protein
MRVSNVRLEDPQAQDAKCIFIFAITYRNIFRTSTTAELVNKPLSPIQIVRSDFRVAEGPFRDSSNMRRSHRAAYPTGRAI